MSSINPRVRDATRFVNDNVAEIHVAHDQGAGMAFQVVAQAVAAAVTDATEYLRAVNSLNVAAISTMTAKIVETGDPTPWTGAIATAQDNGRQAAQLFETVGTNAAKVLKAFQDSST